MDSVDRRGAIVGLKIYNLAAQSHVQVSFDTPEYTANADGLGRLHLREAIRVLGREAEDSLLSSLASQGPICGKTFVTRKVTRAVAPIEHGLQQKLFRRPMETRR
jgi:GDP-D-mannose dehydratase